jgi:hypothetical protein
MIDKFRKLVAVTEEMATEWNQMGLDVVGMEVSVEGHGGIVRLGMGREYPVYHPDENQYMPEYCIDYITYYFSWLDGQWVKDEPMVVEAANPFEEREEEIDELPF